MVSANRFESTVGGEIDDSISSSAESESPKKSLDLKKKIEANKNNFFEVFIDIIEDAITLTIETTVKESDASEAKLWTEISLVEGDIKNEIGSQFITNENYKGIRDFHKEQVTKGEETIKKNLESLHNLVNYLIDVYKQDKNKDIS